MTDTKHTKAVTINGDEPLYIALDATASMNTDDAPGGLSRLAYARVRIAEVLKRLPKDTRVSVVSFDTALAWHTEGSAGIDARAALMTASATGAEAEHGRVLEWAMMGLQGQQRATLIIVTDGWPADYKRWEAWLALNERDSSPLHVVVLWVGPVPDGVHLLHGRTRQDEHELTDELEIQLSTHTKSDRPDAALANTMPPSIAPPDAPKPAARTASHPPPMPASAPASKPPVKRGKW